MIKNFIAVAVRSFLRQRLYSIINVVGLATGLACVLLIFLWVRDEVSVNRFHNNLDNIFQVVVNIKNPEQIITWTTTPGPMAEEIKNSLPEVEHITRIASNGNHLFQVNEKNFLESGYYADEAVFSIFTFNILAGDAMRPLPDKSSVAISKTLAEKLFGNEDPIGKTVSIQKSLEQKITAVFADFPTNSTQHPDFVLPFEIHKENAGENFNWGNYDFELFLTLQANTTRDAFSEKLNTHLDKVNQSEDGVDRVDYYVQLYKDRYLHGNFENGVPAGGRIAYVKIFSIVAVFILVIACINFMNMATAKAATRAREVGVRKSIGAQRNSLMLQFIAESTLISLLSMILAIGLVHLVLPLFNLLVGKQTVLHLTDPVLLLSILAIVIITGFFAGSYPAFYLSSFKPTEVLKGTLRYGSGGGSLRKALVIFQFALTIILVASALVINEQIRFIQNKNLGYNRESVIMFNSRGAINQNYTAFRNEIASHAGVLSISKGNQSMIELQNQTSSVNWSGKPEGQNPYFRAMVVDQDMLKTLEFELLEGRLFTYEQNDTNNYVVSNRAVEIMGLKDPVGQQISLWGINGTIVGVVDDFHSRSLQEAIDPIVFLCRPDWASLIYVRIDPAKTQESLSHIERVYKKFNAEYPFEYTFMNDSFDRLYRNEKMTGSLAIGFTTMAIIISALGLLGLAAYTAERRKKEISIRKTLGASVSSLVTMMCKDFAVLSLVAAVVGCPVAYYLMSEFLASYSYHTSLRWEIFAITIVLTSAIALATVIYQVTKAALVNPADTLRSE